MGTRRQFIKTGAAGVFAHAARVFGDAKTNVWIPMPSVPWTQATPIGPHARVSPEVMKQFPPDPSGFATMEESLRQDKAFGATLQSMGLVSTIYADFCLIQDKVGRWHYIGWRYDPKTTDPRLKASTLHHHVSDHLLGPYRALEPIESGVPLPHQPGQHLTMGSPCVIWKDPHTALMFYEHFIDGVNEKGLEKVIDASIRVLESTDAKLESWSRHLDPAFLEQNIILRENFSKDPDVFWDEDHKLYLMYYGTGGGWTDPEDQCVLRVRTSPDLSRWSEPKTLMVPPPGHRAIESMFVLKKDGLYYLWVCGFDWGRMSLYISENPLNFGDPVHNRIMVQSGHAPKIVYSDGQHWMACAGISSEMGHAWGMHDLIGAYIQPLKWVEADEVARAKITRL